MCQQTGVTGRYIELGADTASASYIDFHSCDGYNNDFDARILSTTSQSSSSTGSATLSFTANNYVFNSGDVHVQSNLHIGGQMIDFASNSGSNSNPTTLGSNYRNGSIRTLNGQWSGNNLNLNLQFSGYFVFTAQSNDGSRNLYGWFQGISFGSNAAPITIASGGRRCSFSPGTGYLTVNMSGGYTGYYTVWVFTDGVAG